MENSRLTKIIQVLSVILLATMVGAYLWSLFSRKEDKDLQAHNDWHRQQLDELARSNDLLERTLAETEKLPAVKKGGQVIELTPEKKEPAPRKNPPAPGKKRKPNPPQGRQAATPTVVANAMVKKD